MDRVIIHFDMDMFYAAVEILDNPNLRGKPLCIAPPPPSRGVITTASYEAREFGLHSGMPISQAYSLCKEAIFIPPNMDKYERVNLEILDIISKYSDKIEFVSLDEAYIDVTNTYHLFGSKEELALMIQKDIFISTGLTCSVGIGYCKIAAKLASEKNKPCGFGTLYTQEEFISYIAHKKLTKINGIGEKLGEKIHKYFGKNTLGELLQVPYDEFTFYFGKVGHEIYHMIRGVDNREVASSIYRKNYGSRRTFQNNIKGIDEVMRRLVWNIKTVSWQLKNDKKVAYTVSIIIRYSTFKSITKSLTVKNPIQDTLEIYNICLKLAKEVDLNQEIRQIGVRLSNTKTGNTYYQLSLLDTVDYPRREQLNSLQYELKRKFGREVIKDFIDYKGLKGVDKDGYNKHTSSK